MGGLDTNLLSSTELPLKKSGRISTNDRSLRDMTDIFKKKYDASQESKLMSFAVQKTMIMKNKEQSKLAMIQKMDLFNNQIDTAENRPNFNLDVIHLLDGFSLQNQLRSLWKSMIN